MTMVELLENIKLELTGGILELEIDDDKLKLLVNKCLKELSRYFDESLLVTVPFASCIDLKDFNSSAIVKVYRQHGLGSDDNASGIGDPLYMQQWQIFSNAGTMYNLQDYLLNYAAWTTMSQIRNTLSTDLDWKEDKQENKLYINNYLDTPDFITIEYIPKLCCVEDIKSEYWQEVLMRLCIAETKVVLGRIRTRFTQSNALWQMDGQTMLDEGKEELKELREVLRSNDNLVVGID